ncbi:MAG: hypothetical protein IJU75_03545, partial [Clostridia bacterium]|nr:hypothetical protein [Clostridia bacterium]
MKLKRCLSLVLALLFAVGLVHLSASDTDAGKLFNVSLGFTSDYYVYAPGAFDIYVVTDAEEPKYQWCAHFSGTDYYVDLVDNEYYSGTSTHHLSLITKDGNADDDWSEIAFTCLVTDKNGVKVYGPEVHMIVLTHKSLLDKLEKNGVKFSSFGLTNYTAKRETDGVTYFDVYADKGISTKLSYGVLDKEQRDVFEASEGEIKVEKFITENSKSVEYTGDTYYPNKLGNGALTVTGNLVLYMRGQRMETIDTKTYVVNVLAPEGIGAATTKSAAALQDSMSFHPVTLTNVPAGTYVRLLEDKGSFWKVAVNGYMGYIPVTSLNVMENIGAVSVSVAEPVAYAKADNAVTLEPGAGYRADPQKNQQIWYDRTANRFLDPGDSFLPGHQYRVNVWLSADAGKRFVTKDGKPSVSSFVNGMTAKTNKAYEQDPEEVIEVAFDFDHVHDLKKVNRVYPTCTTAGKEYHYECSCGWRFEDAAGKVKITDENWGIIPALGHRESAWSSNGTQHYKVCQRRECGETLPETKGAHTGGTATCEHGAYCDVCGLEYGAKVSHKWSKGWDYKDENGHAHFCAYLCGTHSEIKPHRPGKEATATEPQVCLDCGFVLKEAGSHTHTLKKVAAKAADCFTPGTKEHWICTDCGAKFSDDKGLKPVTD